MTNVKPHSPTTVFSKMKAMSIINLIKEKLLQRLILKRKSKLKLTTSSQKRSCTKQPKPQKKPLLKDSAVLAVYSSSKLTPMPKEQGGFHFKLPGPKAQQSKERRKNGAMKMAYLAHQKNWTEHTDITIQLASSNLDSAL